jgi:hypothetical protein
MWWWGSNCCCYRGQAKSQILQMGIALAALLMKTLLLRRNIGKRSIYLSLSLDAIQEHQNPHTIPSAESEVDTNAISLPSRQRNRKP